MEILNGKVQWNGRDDIPCTYGKTEDGKLYYLQRNLAKLDANELEKAEAILKTVFGDIVNDEDN